MYLSNLVLNRSRLALGWVGNPYRVHQRLLLAAPADPRLLFRIEAGDTGGARILAQTHTQPDWPAAFAAFPALDSLPQVKAFDLALTAGARYRFRLLANPVRVVSRADGNGVYKSRQGLLDESEQHAWLARKLADAGAQLLGVRVLSASVQKSAKNPAKDVHTHAHLAVLFEGLLLCADAARLADAVAAGIGPAKGYGFGLLSLARSE